MRAIEYWGRWEDRGDRIWIIEGARKAGGGKPCMRDIPNLGRCVPPPLTRSAFMNRLVGRTSAFRMPDLRRTFANWMEQAALPKSRRDLYMGHSLSMTELYSQPEREQFLATDATTLSAWSGPKSPEKSPSVPAKVDERHGAIASEETG